MWSHLTLRQLNTLIILAAILPAIKAASLNSSSQNVGGRIVGGTETSIVYFPHQASLQNNGMHVCGAAILSRYFLITAAHCVRSLGQPLQLKVRVGSSEHARGGAVHAVRRVIIHEKFNQPTSLNNDIALLQLEIPLTLTRFVQPIGLVSAWDDVKPSAVLFVSGWGATSSDSQKVSPNLRYTFVSLWNHGACTAAFKGYGIVTKTMLCAGAEKGGRDSCQGDSGGPLVTFVGGVMKLYGLISWGISCAESQYPGVYTSMQFYVDWIHQNMARM